MTINEFKMNGCKANFGEPIILVLVKKIYSHIQ